MGYGMEFDMFRIMFTIVFVLVIGAGAATSVGANIHEAHPAKSKRKMSNEKTATSNSAVAYTIR